MNLHEIDSLDWNKGDGLLPAIVQDVASGKVLMLGFVNREALRRTLEESRVTFYSRTKKRLWMKGETSGAYLDVVAVTADCDRDCVLITARPHGSTCHTGSSTCFGDNVVTDVDELGFLATLQSVIAQRIADRPESSYTARLWAQGSSRMAQKVGEEGVEVALAAVTQDDQRLIGESADLLFHLVLLLKSRNLTLGQVVAELAQRHAAKT